MNIAILCALFSPLLHILPGGWGLGSVLPQLRFVAMLWSIYRGPSSPNYQTLLYINLSWDVAKNKVYWIYLLWLISFCLFFYFASKIILKNQFSWANNLDVQFKERRGYTVYPSIKLYLTAAIWFRNTTPHNHQPKATPWKFKMPLIEIWTWTMIKNMVFNLNKPEHV